MAEVKMPEGVPKPQLPPGERAVKYDVTGGKKEKTGASKVWDDIKTSLKQEIIMPTMHTLLYQLIVRATGMSLDNIFGNMGGSGYSGPSFPSVGSNSGFYGNRNYNPGAANRFNQNNSWTRNPAPQPQQQQNNAMTDWKFGRYYTRADAIEVIDYMKRYIDANGRLSIYKYCELRNKPCDWSLHNYGWSNFDEAYPHYVYDHYTDEHGRSMPFEIIPPEPVYFGEFVK